MSLVGRLLNISLTAVSLIAVAPAAYAETKLDVLRSYYAVDPHLPLHVKISGEHETPTSRVIEYSFTGFDNEPIRAVLEIPSLSGDASVPVVVLLHGITQSADQWWRTDDGPYSFPASHRAALLESNVAVMAFDLRNHGARVQAHDFQNPYTYLEEGYLEAARKMIAQSAMDLTRGLDTLSEFEGVDADRVSIVGFSLGAWVGYIGAALNENVEKTLLIGMPFLDVSEGHTTSFTAQHLYAGAFNDRLVHFIGGTLDTFYDAEHIEGLVNEIGASARLTWVESGHDFPHSTATITAQFLTPQ
jgi:pimeloyl-ACP methyl ester carboxylesterase